MFVPWASAVFSDFCNTPMRSDRVQENRVAAMPLQNYRDSSDAKKKRTCHAHCALKMWRKTNSNDFVFLGFFFGSSADEQFEAIKKDELTEQFEKDLGSGGMDVPFHRKPIRTISGVSGIN